MIIKGDLAGIVGSKYVSDQPETLEKYSKDYSFVQPRMPSCVVYTKNTGEDARCRSHYYHLPVV